MFELSRVLIVSFIPYFLKRENSWFEKNLNSILEAQKTQIFWEKNTLFLEKGSSFSLSFLLKKLDEMGYEKVWEIKSPGEFALRGGILDIFPINLNFGIRVEFLGNKIENIFKLPVEIKDEKKEKEILERKLKSQKLFSDLRELKPGDYLVHLDHGIGVYKQQTVYEGQQYYVIEYAQGDKLYVPLGLERKLSRYIGFSEPKISRLGSQLWIKTKKKVKKEAEKLAKELLEIYAKRETTKRPPYLPDDEIDHYLESTFPFEETPDQKRAIEEIKKDLEKEKPMDRLLCGDVGFGKTEVALRAMVKAVKSGYQAAMLCPTTILAHQHYQNLKRRLKNLPINLALLARIVPKKEQKKIIERIEKGKIDIVVGTHRLLSNDVKFKNLQLLVIDDEHKFGVRQKEKLKKMKERLDVLSLSATPIPRTLYMALSSLREISLIQTPPPGRLPIKTFILPFSEKTIKKAIENELKRGGQVYYLHNRIETIGMAKKFLESLEWKKPPKFAIAHAKLKEEELIKVMKDFQDKKYDVLIATTIIEAGLDLPNVNTLIVADATKLGLSQAYQIRGRIGRSHLQAFAYFLYSTKLTPLAKERLKALKEAKELGSGYKIALKDLEIRGAGNILGKEQSGNINKVGLNLYCQMLSVAIEKFRKGDKF
jgi:transcription-repair coupling factor (superfamily II helicase)